MTERNVLRSSSGSLLKGEQLLDHANEAVAFAAANSGKRTQIRP
jgi:hypothetical protein